MGGHAADVGNPTIEGVDALVLQGAAWVIARMTSAVDVVIHVRCVINYNICALLTL